MTRAFANGLLLFVFATLPSWEANSSASNAPPVPEDAAFADGDFAVAERNYSDTLARTPNDAGALAGLARIRLYQEKRADARDLATRALAAEPNNTLAKRVLAGVDAREASFDSAVYHIAMPPQGDTIHFVVTDPLPILQVRVNGKQTVYFVIDTGAPDVVLDEAFAKELGLQSTAGGQGTFAGGQRAAISRSLLPQIEIGAIDVKNVPVTLMPTRGFALSPGIRIDGVIGTGLLQHFLTTLDYVQSTLTLRPRSESEAFQALRAQSGVASVPMWLVGDHFIFARARINDAPEGLFSIDTGLAGGGLQATKAVLDAAHVKLDEARARTGQGGAGTVRLIPFRASATLGNVTVADVEGVFTPDGDQFGIFPFRVAGTLSHGFFRKYALTFDFVAMRLVVK